MVNSIRSRSLSIGKTATSFSLIAAFSITILIELLPGVAPVMVFGLDGLTLPIIVFRVGSWRLPAEQGARQHRRCLRLGHIDLCVVFIYDGLHVSAVMAVFIRVIITGLTVPDGNDLIAAGQYGITLFRQARSYWDRFPANLLQV